MFDFYLTRGFSHIPVPVTRLSRGCLTTEGSTVPPPAQPARECAAAAHRTQRDSSQLQVLHRAQDRSPGTGLWLTRLSDNKVIMANCSHRRMGAGVSTQPRAVTPSPGRAGLAASSGSQGSPAAVDVIDLIVLVEGNGLHAVREGPVQHSDACRTEHKGREGHGSPELHKLQTHSWLEAAPLCSPCRASPAGEGGGSARSCWIWGKPSCSPCCYLPSPGTSGLFW